MWRLEVVEIKKGIFKNILKNSILNKGRSTLHKNLKNTQVEVEQKQEDIFRHKCCHCFSLKITLQKFL